jgi:hypothetical protein
MNAYRHVYLLLFDGFIITRDIKQFRLFCFRFLSFNGFEFIKRDKGVYNKLNTKGLPLNFSKNTSRILTSVSSGTL